MKKHTRTSGYLTLYCVEYMIYFFLNVELSSKQVHPADYIQNNCRVLH
jgi:hypothetical protein